MKKFMCLSIALTTMLTCHAASESSQIRDKIDEFLNLSQVERFKTDNYVPFLEYIQTVEPGNRAAIEAFAAYRQTHPTAFNPAHPIMQWLLKGNQQPLADQINMRRSGSAAAQSSEESLRAPDQPETFTLLDEYDIAQIDPNELAFLEGIDGSAPQTTGVRNIHAVLPDQISISIPDLQTIALRKLLDDLLNPIKLETEEAFKAYLNRMWVAKENFPRQLIEAKKTIFNYFNKGYQPYRSHDMSKIEQTGLDEHLSKIEAKLQLLQYKSIFANYLKFKGIPDFMLDSVINKITPMLIRMIYLETGNLNAVPHWLMEEHYQHEKAKEPILTLSLQDLIDNNMVGTFTDDELPLKITYNRSNDILYITEAPKPKDPNINIVPHIKIDFDNLDDIKKYSGIDWSVVYPIKRLELSLNNLSLKPNLFKNLKTITHLGLSNSGIEKIPQYAFRDLPNLEILDLQDNNIDYIEPGTFTNLRKLRQVFFSGNSITDPEERIRIEKEITDASPNATIHWEPHRII